MDQLNKIRTFLAQASIREATDDDVAELATSSLAAEVEKSAGPLGKDGKPRMLIIAAWMAHEGRNANGQAFVKEELEKRVGEGLFSPPHGGMIDFNHDFDPRGFWYKSSFAFDSRPNVQKWGIFVTGAIWAWRFPQLADTMIAEMHREGMINVSMACIADTVEFTRAYPEHEGSFTEVLHNPVFLTTSLLDLPPADSSANGKVSEDPAEELQLAATEVQTLIFPKKHWENADEAKKWAKDHGFKSSKVDETGSSYRFRQKDPSLFDENSFRTICLTGAKRDDPGSDACRVKAVIGTPKGGEAIEHDDKLDQTSSYQEESVMDEQALEVLKQEFQAAKDALQAAQTRIAELEGTVATHEATIVGLEARITESDVAVKTASDAKEIVEKDLADTKTQLAEVQAKLDEYMAREAEAELDARLTSRVASLPAIVQKNLEEHPEKDELLGYWRAMNDAEFDKIKKSYELISTIPDFVRKSEVEGVIPAGGATQDETGLKKYIR